MKANENGRGGIESERAGLRVKGRGRDRFQDEKAEGVGLMASEGGRACGHVCAGTACTPVGRDSTQRSCAAGDLRNRWELIGMS